MLIHVITISGKIIQLFVDETSSVENLKMKLRDIEGYPVDQQRLIFEGHQLEDMMVLRETGIKQGSVVHSVLKLRGGGLPQDDEGGLGDRNVQNRSMEELANFSHLPEEGIRVDDEEGDGRRNSRNRSDERPNHSCCMQ